MQIIENVPLAPMTTLKVGGAARYFATAVTAADVRQAVDWAKSRQLALFVLGGGSNLVIADTGFPRPGAQHRHRRRRASPGKRQAGVRSRRGSHLGRARRPGSRRQLRRPGMHERNSRHRGRHAGAERRRVRAGSFRNHRGSAGAGSPRRAVAQPLQSGVRVRLSQQHLQHRRARALHHFESGVRARSGRRADHPLPRPAGIFCRRENPAHTGRCARGGKNDPSVEGDADRGRRRGFAQRRLIFQESRARCGGVQRALPPSPAETLPSYPAPGSAFQDSGRLAGGERRVSQRVHARPCRASRASTRWQSSTAAAPPQPKSSPCKTRFAAPSRRNSASRWCPSRCSSASSRWECSSPQQMARICLDHQPHLASGYQVRGTVAPRA